MEKTQGGLDSMSKKWQEGVAVRSQGGGAMKQEGDLTIHGKKVWNSHPRSLAA